MSAFIPQNLFEVVHIEKDISDLKRGNIDEIFYSALTGIDVAMKQDGEQAEEEAEEDENRGNGGNSEEESENEEVDEFEEEFKESRERRADLR